MINGKKILAIIPARGGSKGVPRKNIRYLAGKPLIAWTFEQGKKSQYIDRIILSSEDEEIINVAKTMGCDVPFIRPQYLSQDNTPGIEVVLHALNELEDFEYIVLLQPTSPLRTANDIDQCIKILYEKKAHSCVTVVEPSKSPYWMFTFQQNGRIKQFIEQKVQVSRRQDLPDVYALNGSVYVAEVEWLKKRKSFLTEETVGHVMPKSRSYDIDSEEDFLICEYLITNNCI